MFQTCGTMFHNWPKLMTNFNQLWDKILGLDPPFIALVATIMRNLWSRRNEFIFKSSFQAPLSVIQSETAELEGYTKANKLAWQPLKSYVRREDVKWNLPKQGFVKANWDALVSAKTIRWKLKL